MTSGQINAKIRIATDVFITGTNWSANNLVRKGRKSVNYVPIPFIKAKTNVWRNISQAQQINRPTKTINTTVSDTSVYICIHVCVCVCMRVCIPLILSPT